MRPTLWRCLAESALIDPLGFVAILNHIRHLAAYPRAIQLHAAPSSQRAAVRMDMNPT